MLTRRWLERDEATALAVVVVAAPALAFFGSSERAGWPGVGVCLVAALALLAFLVPSLQVHLRAALQRHRTLAVAIPSAFAVYGAVATLLLGTGGWLPVVAWPVLVAAALAAIGSDVEALPAWRLLLAALALALLAGLWDRSLQIRVPGDARLGLAYLSSIALALYLLVIARQQPELDVRLGLSGRELAVALGVTASLAVVVVPVGLALGFLHWEPRWLGPEYAAARLFGLFLFVGLPEELLFRGVVQRAFVGLTTERAGWLLASVLFGMMHLAKHAPPLNWPYALLATAAGLAYGWVYLRTGRIAAAALSHALVNWIWGTWLGA